MALTAFLFALGGRTVAVASSLSARSESLLEPANRRRPVISVLLTTAMGLAETAFVG